MIENNPPPELHGLYLDEQGVDGKTPKTDGKGDEKAASVAVAILSLVAFISVLASYWAGEPLITP